MSYPKADIERLIQLVNEGDVEKLKAQDFEQFQYQGFDPYQIVASLLKVKEAKSIGEKDLQRDIITMVAVGMIKGSVNSNNINKMSDSGKEDLKSLISKYGIKMGGGRGQAAGIITFPRMMATFPDIAVKLVKIIGPKEFRGGPMASTKLPDYIQVQVFPANIPKGLNFDIKKMLLTASLCYSIDQTLQISRIQNPDLKEISSRQMNFVSLGHGSPVPSEEVRLSVFKSLNVKDNYDAIKSVLEIYKEKVDSDFEIMTKQEFSNKLG